MNKALDILREVQTARDAVKTDWAKAHTEIGAHLREQRETAGKTLREVASRLEWSAAYLSDLERGNRPWNEVKIELYMGALK